MELSDVTQLVKLLDKSSLTEISYSDETTKLVLKKEMHAIPMQMAAVPQYMPAQQQMPAYASTAPIASEAANSVEKSPSKLKEITSPMVGTFYASATPGASALVQIGTTVKPGMVLCIIEAMKIMNEIECDIAGIVEEVCVTNEMPVEYGTVLFRVRPA
jgi:acetyl-CoA carboxylase biotin carboxyl carrier protein